MSLENELTASERLIWTGQRLDPEAPLYNMALAFDLSGPIDVEAFGSAFRDLVARTDALRTVFREEGGEPRRRVLDQVDARVELIAAPEEEYDDPQVRRMLEARTQRVFPLDAPLFDTCLIRRRSDRFIWYLNQHHLITDAWSVGVLHRRLGALYDSARRAPAGVGSAATMAFPQYASFVAHHRELRGSRRLAQALRHWDATPPPCRLALYGCDRPGTGRTQRLRIRLGAERTRSLRVLAGRPPFRALTVEQSLFHVMATVLSSWLHRIADERDVRIGCPWHNRTSAESRDTAGLFIELYPLRVCMGEAETFASLGRQVARGTMETMRHVVPGASASAGARGFGVVLNYITANLTDFGGVPSRADWIHSGFGDPAHRVRVQVHDFDDAGEPVVDFDLDEGTFGDRERTWAVRHFFALFDAMARELEQRIAAVPLSDWNDEAASARLEPATAPSTSVLGLFRERAREAPEAVAIVDGDCELTYGEVARAAASVAVRLRDAGATREAVIGLLFDRSADLIIGMLGVMEAGAAFMPLEPGHPDLRLARQARDAGAALVLTSPDHVVRVSEWGTTALVVSASTAGPAASVHREADLDLESLAYVLYTSGSTGQPKGVEVTHRSLADYAIWAARVYTDGERLRFPLFTSPAFDLTLTSIFVPLVTGGAIVVYRGERGGGGLIVRRVFEEDRVDVVKLTPSHLALIRDLDLHRSRVRRLVVGGEDLKRRTALAAHEAFGGRVEILNEYGPTEATVACMLHRFDPNTDTGESVPIGRPADGARIHVVDSSGAPVLRGTSGELWIGGPRVARGYRHDAERTAGAFVPDPLAPGARLYRTGDVGRWDADGVLHFLGRRDAQVKIRGARVELAEVEAALARHPAIHACAAAVSLPQSEAAARRCSICGLEAAHPEAQIDAEGVCAVCRRFEGERSQVERYFGSMEELRQILGQARASATGPHDCLMMFSGGKDSTYALCRIVELGARPLVFMFDNGFISAEAKTNVRRVVDMLGLELVIGETPAMPAIFADSLARFSNVCNGCFKTIYTVAMQLAVARGITHIVTGLSRGQIFETRLADLYRRGIYDPAEVDRTILEARKAYHRMDDAVARLVDGTPVATDEVLDRIHFVDFYRYCDDTLDAMLDYVTRHTPWIRPSDTGRSTNCLINQAGIYVHRTERGYHNYAMPYSWDVRLGHKRRAAAVAELDDDLDPATIRAMLDRVGYRERPAPPPEPRLVAYYTAAREVGVTELRRFLEESLPSEIVPSAFVRLDTLPVGPGGKIDRDALPRPDGQRPVLPSAVVPPRTEAEALLVDAWVEVLGLHPIGVHDDFFALGGDSMQCIQIVSAARARGMMLAPRELFAHPTIAELARIVRREPAPAGPAPAMATAQELSELMTEFGG